MKISKVCIENFRSIKRLELELSDTTVLIGANNAGKTAILDAIRIALSRKWGQRGTGFTEYDVHLCEARTDPKVGDAVSIEIEVMETVNDSWPDDVVNSLSDVLQTDPVSGKSAVLMKVSCAWDSSQESFVPKWEFLNTSRRPLAGRSARATNLSEFFEFLPVFYLDAMRDAGDEYHSKSQFWGRLLRTVQIPPELENRSKKILDMLNKRLLSADARLENLAIGISSVGKIAACDGQGTANLRVLPLNTWDLLSKAEVIYQTAEKRPWLPLLRHGQGIQSLSVIFLFKVFVDTILTEIFRPQSSAVLLLEEPESHLHPQAARTLFRHIGELIGQKIVSSHSPYFLQHVPFKDIRVVRDGKDGTKIWQIPREFRVRVPLEQCLKDIIQVNQTLLEYDSFSGHLVAKGCVTKDLYRSLLKAFATHQNRQTIHTDLRNLAELDFFHFSEFKLPN